jgi:8-oxo-dGTP diphosphatase
MSAWLSAPVFGDRTRYFPTIVRPSAYGIVPDGEGRIAVARTTMGVYLPGGGRERGETPETTVVREAREECGLVVRVGAWRRVAIEHVSFAAESSHFEKWSTFCDAEAVASLGAGVEADHVLAWVMPEDAVRMLRHESHRWAVREWLGSVARR